MTNKNILAPARSAPAARAVLPVRVDFETFLSKLSAKDRLNAERHLTACDTESGPQHAALWRRLACVLKTLAPHATKLNGRDSIQFYVPDGKYKLQVFALEDRRDGKLRVYCRNILKEALAEGVLSVARDAAGTGLYKVRGATEALVIEELDENTPEPGAFFQHMLGWGRKAIRVGLPLAADEAQIAAVEGLCYIAARLWLPVEGA
jgi:hypothetical protein